MGVRRVEVDLGLETRWSRASSLPDAAGAATAASTRRGGLGRVEVTVFMVVGHVGPLGRVEVGWRWMHA